MTKDVRPIDAELLLAQRDWSGRTFGPGPRTEGITAHLQKELAEIRSDPLDLKEWIDVAILAFDGAWRTGVEPEAILTAFRAKLEENFARDWPVGEFGQDQVIEHIRS